MIGKTYKEVLAELDALVDEFTLLKRSMSTPVCDQLTTGIDTFLTEKLADAYSIESEYVWYSMVYKYPNIYGEEIKYLSVPEKLVTCTQELKDKYQ